MLIVACMGGLGNQMFQYTFYLKLKTIGIDAKFYTNYFNNNVSHNGSELLKIFKIGNQDIIENLNAKIILYKILYKIGVSKFYYHQNEPIKAIKFFPEFYSKNNMFLAGYWQSYKYFSDIENEIRALFSFKNELDEKNKKILENIQNENSISVHIRRGDYLKPENKIFQNICTLNYYKNSIEYMNKFIENPTYYVFSNDIEWCRKNLDIKNVTYVDWNTGEDSYKDMQLMSCCKHNIIANSSFSWWGAWLNNNPGKIVCVPERWFDLDGCETKDIYPSQWIKIKIQ